MKTNWRYYNHAFLPKCCPHEQVDTAAIKDGSVWKQKKGAYLARWASDFDCGYETEWWYVIKDDSFDLAALKSKRRYEINKGQKFFEVRPIDPQQYVNALYNVQVTAFSAYPEKYRPTVDKEKFVESVYKNWREQNICIYGAFYRDTNELCGYAYLAKKSTCLEFNVLKTNPKFEKYAVNAALVYQILQDYASDLQNKNLYICDGERSVLHETKFQDYLEKYFQFRKAYCKLNVVYNPKIKWLVKIAYPFRKLLLKFDGINIVHQLNGVLKMEEIVRKQKNGSK